MVRTAPTDKLADQFQSELELFDQAMAALREEADRRRQAKLAGVMALVPGSVSGSAMKSKRDNFLDEPAPPKPTRTTVVPHDVMGAPAPKPEEPKVPEPVQEPAKKSSKGRFLVYTMIFMVIGGIGGGMAYKYVSDVNKLNRRKEIMLLERLGAGLVNSRRWEEATRSYLRIEELDPGSAIAANGRRSIEVGMQEEQEQFVGYWTGESQAAFEAGRLDDAREAADKVLARYPEDEAVLALSEKIRNARNDSLRKTLGAEVREAVEQRDWAVAEDGVTELANAIPGDDLITVLAKEIAAGREQERLDLTRARELAASAKLRDAGKFDPKVMEWMREAIALAPHDPEVREVYEKVASYSRTLHVPKDVPTLADALKNVRAKDRVVLGEGTFDAGVVVDFPVQIEGAGEGGTMLESTALEAPAITFGPGATGAVVTGITFQCKGFDASDKRFPAVQVRGSEVEFSGCTFKDASGNGLEVLDAGQAEAVQCGFENNGWDGFSARGSGSRMVARECKSTGNFAHGYEIWDGASAVVTDSQATKNSRNGILVDSAAEKLELTGNTITGNREYGILLSAGAAGTVHGNSCSENHLGGMLIRFAALSVRVEKNTLEDNYGDGLTLEQGLRADTYETNRLRSNDGRDLRQNVSFAAGN
ncbi:right-handed parallel beta-helix repeat-containing protein [Haloferula sargassicola]